MRKGILLFIVLLTSLSGVAQVAFEKGYFIDDEGQRIECLIKNVGWLNNPSRFEYKREAGSATLEGSIQTASEFGIDSLYKFVRQTVNIDRSNDQLGSLSDVRQPDFQQETLFLKTVVDGQTKLFSYLDDQILRYFFQIGDGEITQLINKTYRTRDNKIAKNQDFRQQLLNNLRCPDQEASQFYNFGYFERALKKQFIRHNECTNSDYLLYEDSKRPFRELLNVRIRPGVVSSSLEFVDDIEIFRNAQFDTETSFRIGIEAELVIPYFKNKLSIFTEPTYQYYSGRTETPFQSLTVDYQSIELPFGIRYSFFLNDHSKLFLNTGLLIDIGFSSILELEGEMITHELEPSINLFFGAGYSYKRFSLEARVNTLRDLLPTFTTQGAEFQSASLVFGFLVF